MQITEINVHLVKLPPRRDHNWASKMNTPIGHHAIVEVVTDEGIIGWGEAPAGLTWGGAHGRYFGESPETVREVIDNYLAPNLIGMDPTQISVVHAKMDKVAKGNFYAKAAIDIACHDITGKRSEEHTSELQSRENLVCRLLLEKKKTTITNS